MNRYALKTRSRTSPSRPILSPTDGIRNQLVGQSHATNQNRLRANTLPASTSEIRPTHRRRCDRRALAVGKGQWQDLVGGGYVADVARISCRIENDDPLAAEQLLPLVCDELRKLASAKLVRGHFFAAAAEAMRRILVERARHNRSLKAGATAIGKTWPSSRQSSRSQTLIIALEEVLATKSRTRAKHNSSSSASLPA